MTKPLITIHNTETGEIIEREMNDEELAAYQVRLENYAKEQEVLAEAQAKRQALLDKLGITEDEAKLLLGGN